MAQKFTVPITVKQLTSTGSDAITVFVDADVYARLKLEAGGRITWGPGSGAGDTNLYRDSANVLKTDDTFKAAALFVNGIEIDPTGAVTNHVLQYNGTKFVSASVTFGGGSTGAETLDQLTDVTITSAANGDFLKWNGTAWVNDPIDLGTDTTGNYMSGVSAGTGISVTHTPGEGSTATIGLNATLDNLSNVTVPTPSTNDVLQYNGSAWVNVSASVVGATNLDGLTDVVITAPEEFQGISYNGTSWVNSHIPLVSYVRNAETTTITTGTCVYLFGSTGDHATVKRADNTTDATSSKTVGVAGANIAASQNGPIVTRGYVDGIDLSVGYTAGDVLWLDKNGAFTKTKPSAPDHLVFIGVVVRATNNGIIYVATQNGYELEELHDVKISSPIGGDYLRYNSASAIWVNDQINLGTDTVGNYMSDVTAGTGVTVTHTPGEGSNATIAIGQNVATSASVTFAHVSAPVTGNLTGNASTATALQTARTINLGGDLSGSASFNGTADITITATVQPNSVVLGTDTTGNFVADVVAGTGLTVTHTPGEGSSASVALNATLDDLSNVSVPSPTNGDVLKYNGSIWTSASASSGGASVTISDTPPSSPTAGNLWFESDTGRTFIYYDSSWIEVGAVSAGSRLAVSATPPTNPVTGDTWFDSDDGATYVYYGTTWVEIGATAVDTLLSTIDAKGDLLVGTADNTVSKLTAGTNGQYLSVDSSTATGLKWATVDALPSQATNSGKYLTTNGTTASWATVSTDVMTDTKNAAIILMDIGA